MNNDDSRVIDNSRLTSPDVTTHDSRLTSHEIAISVRNLSKKYRLYDSPQHRLKEALNPFRKKYHREFWALRDVSFEVKKGETIGIIGKNGCGKSTLLQLLCGVLQPTQGEISVNGRISALLELGAGFNPDFTGRENVYMNGSILGLSRQDIDEKFDDIAAFADIGDFIDQPVKTYSSGMFVRVAFAVAINISPDILVVDEALAVGDSLFQKRCYQKIESLVAQGVTLLFVSHDQESIRTLTSKAILLKDGRQHKVGLSSDVVLEYRRLLHEDESAYYRNEITRLERVDAAEMRHSEKTSASSDRFSFGDGDAEILEVKVLNANDEISGFFYPGDLLKISVKCKMHKNMTHLNVAVRLRNKEGVKMYSWGTLNQDIAIWAGLASGDIFWDRHFHDSEMFEVIMESKCTLGTNLYEVQAAITEENDNHYGSQRVLHWKDEATFFQVGMSMREYQFGGVCDMKMVSYVRQ